jgi:hypothetical protein
VAVVVLAVHKMVLLVVQAVLVVAEEVQLAHPALVWLALQILVVVLVEVIVAVQQLQVAPVSSLSVIQTRLQLQHQQQDHQLLQFQVDSEYTHGLVQVALHSKRINYGTFCRT